MKGVGLNEVCTKLIDNCGVLASCKARNTILHDGEIPDEGIARLHREIIQNKSKSLFSGKDLNEGAVLLRYQDCLLGFLTETNDGYGKMTAYLKEIDGIVVDKVGYVIKSKKTSGKEMA